MDQTRTICLQSCPVPPFAPPEGDYSVSGFDDITLSTLCCLEYGAPYLSSGFAVLSKPTTAPFDVTSALFNPDVCNVATVIVIMAIAAGWVASILERRTNGNPHLGSPSRGAYWGLMQFLNSVDEKPHSRPGRVLTIMWLAASIISLSVITSIISAKLTTAGLSSKKIMRLGDIGSGTLCVESAYPTAMQFVLRDPQHPVKIVEEEINVCIDMLINNTVQAVFTDQPVLQWMVANYQIVNGFVSPLLGPNPFSFVYASGSLLRQYTNPPELVRSVLEAAALLLVGEASVAAARALLSDGGFARGHQRHHARGPYQPGHYQHQRRCCSGGRYRDRDRRWCPGGDLDADGRRHRPRLPRHQSAAVAGWKP